MWIVRRIAPTLVVTLGLTACKEDGIEVGKYVDALPNAVCDQITVCNCDYPNGAQVDHCKAQLGVDLETLAELNGVEGLKFDGECAQREIDELGSLGCGVEVFDPDAKCETPCKVWFGPMDKGGTCTSINGYDNCKQGMVCEDGACVHPCEEPDLPKIGESCSLQYGCDEGAYCDGITSPLFPVCAPLPGVGQPCVEDLGFLCAEDLVCDLSEPDAPVCATLPALGEECPDGVCADDLFCDGSMAPAVCANPPALGEACPFGFCAQPNMCEDEVCVAPRPAVCGYYGGLPDDGGSASGNTTVDPTVDPTNGTETGGFDTGLDTGGFDTGLDTGGVESTGGADLGDCCTPHETPSCSNVEVAACVCELDTACCLDPWSELCVGEVASFGCGAC